MSRRPRDHAPWLAPCMIAVVVRLARWCLTALTLLAGCGQAEPVEPGSPGTVGDQRVGDRARRTGDPAPAVKPPPRPARRTRPVSSSRRRPPASSRERSVPRPADLGRGWEQFVDPGDVAEGYTGNGAWVRERGAAEVVQAVVPLGCVGMTSAPVLPVPKHALEATYRGPGDAPGVALVLDYASDGQGLGVRRRDGEDRAGLLRAVEQGRRGRPADRGGGAGPPRRPHRPRPPPRVRRRRQRVALVGDGRAARLTRGPAHPRHRALGQTSPT